MNTTTIRPAQATDWPAIAELLTRYALPLDGAQAHLNAFVVMTDAAGAIHGVAGLERYGATGLLRSVAVAEPRSGVGAALVRALLDRAKASGITQVVLLTTTAADYFPRFGFRRIDRQDAPAEVTASVEFQTACPASATVMLLELA
ncbi:MAG TPA: GNAT family N-acetyltransferase [Chloroflexi bacterium]|nr:GNAT family N-acetyltransferase [Chloroflexota bacterium]HHW84881.1 GNAT family N-acetyltransferase [Chloroflexota bacterium]